MTLVCAAQACGPLTNALVRWPIALHFGWISAASLVNLNNWRAATPRRETRGAAEHTRTQLTSTRTQLTEPRTRPAAAAAPLQTQWRRPTPRARTLCRVFAQAREGALAPPAQRGRGEREWRR